MKLFKVTYCQFNHGESNTHTHIFCEKHLEKLQSSSNNHIESIKKCKSGICIDSSIYEKCL